MSFHIAGIVIVIIAAGTTDRVDGASPVMNRGNFQYCDDVISQSKIREVKIGDCTGSICDIILGQPSYLQLHYAAGGSYTSVDYMLRLVANNVSYDIVSGTSPESIQVGNNYNFTLPFKAQTDIRPGNYSLRLLRECEETVEVCIEIDVQVVMLAKEGECDPDECIEKGYCTEYSRCVKDPNSGLGSWKTLNCSQDLFWNPDARNSSEHGGTCDFFLNLSPKLQDEYKNDTKCIPPCEWWEDGQCSPTYKYRKPFDNKTLLERELTLSCPTDPTGSPQLLWNQATYTCDRCNNVKNNDTGTPCPC